LPLFEPLFEVLLRFTQPTPPVCRAPANLGDYCARQSTDIVPRKPAFMTLGIPSLDWPIQH
jgi:hypothetical protein